jgi:hypothetical protein
VYFKSVLSTFDTFVAQDQSSLVLVPMIFVASKLLFTKPTLPIGCKRSRRVHDTDLLTRTYHFQQSFCSGNRTILTWERPTMETREIASTLRLSFDTRAYLSTIISIIAYMIAIQIQGNTPQLSGSVMNQIPGKISTA